MTDKELKEGLSSLAVTHPYWRALDDLMQQAIDQEADAAALMATGEAALRQCGRLAMIKDFAGSVRSHMATLSKPQP